MSQLCYMKKNHPKGTIVLIQHCSVQETGPSYIFGRSSIKVNTLFGSDRNIKELVKDILRQYPVEPDHNALAFQHQTSTQKPDTP